MQRIDGQQNIINKSWSISPQNKVTPQGQTNNPLTGIKMDPAFIVELAALKKIPEGTGEEKSAVEILWEMTSEEEKEQWNKRNIHGGIWAGVREMLDPWIESSDGSAYDELHVSENMFSYGYRELVTSLNEYTEKYGVDAEFRDMCNGFLADLRSNDPTGENKINSYIQNIFETAMRGEQIPLKKEEARELFKDVHRERIQELEDKDAALLDRQMNKVNAMNQERKKERDAKWKVIQKLYKEIQEVSKGDSSEENKEKKIAMIKKEIEKIQEEISKIAMIKFGDIMRANSF